MALPRAKSSTTNIAAGVPGPSLPSVAAEYIPADVLAKYVAANDVITNGLLQDFQPDNADINPMYALLNSMLMSEEQQEVTKPLIKDTISEIINGDETKVKRATKVLKKLDPMDLIFPMVHTTSLIKNAKHHFCVMDKVMDKFIATFRSALKKEINKIKKKPSMCDAAVQTIPEEKMEKKKKKKKQKFASTGVQTTTTTTNDVGTTTTTPAAATSPAAAATAASATTDADPLPPSPPPPNPVDTTDAAPPQPMDEVIQVDDDDSDLEITGHEIIELKSRDKDQQDEIDQASSESDASEDHFPPPPPPNLKISEALRAAAAVRLNKLFAEKFNQQKTTATTTTIPDAQPSTSASAVQGIMASCLPGPQGEKKRKRVKFTERKPMILQNKYTDLSDSSDDDYDEEKYLNKVHEVGDAISVAAAVADAAEEEENKKKKKEKKKQMLMPTAPRDFTNMVTTENQIASKALGHSSPVEPVATTSTTTTVPKKNNKRKRANPKQTLTDTTSEENFNNHPHSSETLPSPKKKKVKQNNNVATEKTPHTLITFPFPQLTPQLPETKPAAKKKEKTNTIPQQTDDREEHLEFLMKNNRNEAYARIAIMSPAQRTANKLVTALIGRITKSGVGCSPGTMSKISVEEAFGDFFKKAGETSRKLRSWLVAHKNTFMDIVDKLEKDPLYVCYCCFKPGLTDTTRTEFHDIFRKQLTCVNPNDNTEFYAGEKFATCMHESCVAPPHLKDIGTQRVAMRLWEQRQVYFCDNCTLDMQHVAVQQVVSSEKAIMSSIDKMKTKPKKKIGSFEKFFNADELPLMFDEMYRHQHLIRNPLCFHTPFTVNNKDEIDLTGIKLDDEPDDGYVKKIFQYTSYFNDQLQGFCQTGKGQILDTRITEVETDAASAFIVHDGTNADFNQVEGVASPTQVDLDNRTQSYLDKYPNGNSADILPTAWNLTEVDQFTNGISESLIPSSNM